MTAPVNEELITLITELQSSAMDKEQSIILLGDLLSRIIANNVTRDENWGVGMTIKAFTLKVKTERKAVGFFGNWAKHHEEKDQDVGC